MVRKESKVERIMPLEITALSKLLCLHNMRGIFPAGTASIRAVALIIRTLSVKKRNKNTQSTGTTIIRNAAKTYNFLLENISASGICATETPSMSMDKKVVECPIWVRASETMTGT